eukprot:4328450-Amphidinium_carterae.1
MYRGWGASQVLIGLGDLKSRGEVVHAHVLARGPTAVAKMRILCMSQSNAAKILDAFEALPREDQSVLAEE